ncbi:hypothetical protein [Legionella tucsonensis]|uniref:Uncharacterized protein n=1 Tax=Legionella tucsonensis TaxID=40335 RepID=A0A0W0ZZH7_9GAMM|nr:hypothetical protein [Legionella tucsonensis]KTD74377.1 hypothetical protein Ltuc_2224 [Legionella tucsonensis]
MLDLQCTHLLNLEELEQAVTAGEWRSSYVEFFENCIRNSGDGFVPEEVSETLLPYIHRIMNTQEWSAKDYTVPTGCTHEIGFKEKFKASKLLPNLDDNELKNYAFVPVDMCRTAWAGKRYSPHNRHLLDPEVIELDHIEFIRDQLPKNQALYIRSSKGR